MILVKEAFYTCHLSVQKSQSVFNQCGPVVHMIPFDHVIITQRRQRLQALQHVPGENRDMSFPVYSIVRITA